MSPHPVLRCFWIAPLLVVIWRIKLFTTSVGCPASACGSRVCLYHKIYMVMVIWRAVQLWIILTYLSSLYSILHFTISFTSNRQLECNCGWSGWDEDQQVYLWGQPSHSEKGGFTSRVAASSGGVYVLGKLHKKEAKHDGSKYCIFFFNFWNRVKPPQCIHFIQC